MFTAFIASFKPSENGCKIPNRPTKTGPCLLCIPAKSFLSHKVKNEILTKLIITKTKLKIV